MSRVGRRSGRRPPTAVLVSWWTRGLLVLAVVVLAIRAVQELATTGAGHVGAGLLMTAYLVWLGTEVPVTFRTPDQPVGESGTLVAYATVRTCLVVAAVAPPVAWSGWSGWMLPPVVLFAAGVVLRWHAIAALGRHYTHHVLRREEHRLVSTGPYRWLRHPAYAGMLLANLGFVLFFPHVASVAAWLLLAGVLVWRVRTEERVLWPVEGYPEFAAARARMLPGVW